MIKEKIAPNEPKFKKLKEMPDALMALLLGMWEREVGGIPKDMQNLVVTYFDAIYVNNPIPEDVYVHEMCHFVRQGNGKDEALARSFCTRYAKDKDFRYQEELMAYREQYKFGVERQKLNRPQAFEYAKYLARQLSSDKYGLSVSFQMALGDITKK